MKNYIEVRKSSALDHNLTELDAAQAVDRGFMEHADWVAHVSRYSFAAKVAMRAKPAGILDVGCGRLNMLYYFYRNRRLLPTHYVGLDLRAQSKWLDAEWLAGADEGKYDLSLVRMDIVQDELPEAVPQQYGLVTCFETFEHVPVEYQPVLFNRLRKWVAPHGVVLLSTPNLGGSDSVAGNHHGQDGEVREQTYETKVELAENAGFTVTASYGTFIVQKMLPNHVWELPEVIAAKEYLGNAWFRVFMAAAYPQYSNNALMVLEVLS